MNNIQELMAVFQKIANKEWKLLEAEADDEKIRLVVKTPIVFSNVWYGSVVKDKGR